MNELDFDGIMVVEDREFLIKLKEYGPTPIKLLIKA